MAKERGIEPRSLRRQRSIIPLYDSSTSAEGKSRTCIFPIFSRVLSRLSYFGSESPPHELNVDGSGYGRLHYRYARRSRVKISGAFKGGSALSLKNGFVKLILKLDGSIVLHKYADDGFLFGRQKGSEVA